MSFDFTCDGKSVVCRITEVKLQISRADNTEDTIDINDVIGVHSPILVQNTEDGKTECRVTVSFINKMESNLWKRKDLVLKGKEDECSSMVARLRTILNDLNRPRKLLVLISPVSGAHKSENVFYETVKPLFDLAGIKTDILVSEYPTHMREYLPTCNLEGIDGLVVMGGDGSFNQCVNGLFERSQKSANVDYNNPEAKLADTMLPIGHIPTGTGNLISGYCYGGCKDIETSILHIIRGKERKFGVTAVYDDSKWLGNCCILLGLGTLSDMVRYSESYRWIKTYRYLVVPAIYFSIKTVPQFKAKLTVKKRDGSVVFTEEELCDLLIANHETFDPNEYFGSKTWYDDENKIMKYHLSSRYNYWKNFMSKLLKGQNYVKPDFVEEIRAVSLKIEILESNMSKTSDGQIKVSLLIDGEYLDLITSALDFRLKEPLIRVFSSL